MSDCLSYEYSMCACDCVCVCLLYTRIRYVRSSQECFSLLLSFGSLFSISLSYSLSDIWYANTYQKSENHFSSPCMISFRFDLCCHTFPCQSQQILRNFSIYCNVLLWIGHFFFIIFLFFSLFTLTTQIHTLWCYVCRCWHFQHSFSIFVVYCAFIAWTQTIYPIKPILLESLYVCGIFGLSFNSNKWMKDVNGNDLWFTYIFWPFFDDFELCQPIFWLSCIWAFCLKWLGCIF